MNLDWGAIVNMGSAGAVIAVVVIMLRAQEKRDAAFLTTLKEQAAEWRAFFTAIASTSQTDIDAMRTTADHLVKTLDNLLSVYSQHDSRAVAIQQAIGLIRTDMAKLIARRKAE